MSRFNSKPQASKRGRAAAKKTIPVRAHERAIGPKDPPKLQIKPRTSLAERFRGAK